jgi:hypothetical protein
LFGAAGNLSLSLAQADRRAIASLGHSSGAGYVEPAYPIELRAARWCARAAVV